MSSRIRVLSLIFCTALTLPALTACQPKQADVIPLVPQTPPPAVSSAAGVDMPGTANTLYHANLCPTLMSLGEDVADIAKHHLGVRYKSGGASPSSGFDCSGFVYWVFSEHGVSVPRDTVRQSRAGIEVAKNDLLPGDILIFRIANTPNGRHSAIYIGDGRFIHSPSTGSRVRIEQLDAAYWKSHYLTARRVLKEPPCDLDLYSSPEIANTHALLDELAGLSMK